MKRCPPQEILDRFLQQQLSPRQLNLLERHLSQCSRCCERLDQLTDAHGAQGMEPLFPATPRERTTPAPAIQAALRLALDSSTVDHVMPTVPGYALLRELGRGGMGAVFEAVQLSLNRPVALKVLLANEFSGAVARKRFLAEAYAVAHIKHPGVVQVHDFGTTASGVPFLAMEFVPGGTLSSFLGPQLHPPRAIARFMAELATAVGVAHQLGIVHRDLKPSNVLLAPRPPEPPPIIRRANTPEPSPLDCWTPKVTDFGLVKWQSADNPAPGLTSTGAIVGTPTYMAPEQASGKDEIVGPASDVYSLGAILYEMITGRPPFRGDTVMETLVQVVTLEVQSPDVLRRGLPADLVTVCLKCLAKDPANRYAHAGELATDLQCIALGKSIARRGGRWRFSFRISRRTIAFGLAMLLVAVVAGGLVSLVNHLGPNNAGVQDPSEAAAPWEPIRVVNSSFEEAELQDAWVHGTNKLDRGWTFFTPGGTQGGYWNPPGESYRGSEGMGTPEGAQGHTILWLFSENQEGEIPTATHVLDATVQVRRSYRLTVAVGRRGPTDSYNTASGGYRLELLAGEDVLGSMTNSQPLRPGQFVDVVLVVAADAISARAIGQPLAIRLSLTATPHRAATDFDHVRLESRPGPN